MAYPLKWRFETDGDTELIHATSLMIDRCADLRPVWPKVFKAWQAHQTKVFATEGGALGQKWAALSTKTSGNRPSYAAWKAEHFPGKTLLRRTDRLWSSLAGETTDTVKYMQRQSLEMGTKVPYAVYHQSREPRTKMPRRSFILLTKETMRKWTGLLHEYLWKGGFQTRIFPR